MSNFKQNGINFTLDNNLQTGEKLHVVKGKIRSGNYPFGDYVEDDASKLINAVEIDWNNADLGNSYYINTTGEKNAI
jgi:hypothetical protein